MDRRGERGEGRIGFVIALAVLGAAIFVGVKVVPVRIAAYEFKDFVREQCRFAAVNRDDKDIRNKIVAKAKELEIPLDKKDLRLERTMSEMIITARYQQPIDLKVTTYVYKFDVKERAPLF
jgi:hypothetical protein